MKRNLFKKFVTAVFAAILTITSLVNIPVSPANPGTDIAYITGDPNPLPEAPDGEPKLS